MLRWALATILTAQVTLGCRCPELRDPSEVFAESSVVFAGKVISMEPPLLLWPPPDIAASMREKFKLSNSELERLMEEDSPAGLEVQKEALRAYATPRIRDRIAAVKTQSQLGALSDEMMDQGVRARFRVEESWKGPKSTFIDLWQEVSSCAVYFTEGETFLIYARPDKRGRLTTFACSRVNAISDAGDDLAYLYHVKHHPQTRTRLFGIVTTDEADLKRPRVWRDVPHPARHVTLRLQSETLTRYAATTEKGNFAFDGLPAGEYKLVAYELKYPEPDRILAGPIRVTIPPRGFARQDLYIPKDLLEKK